MRTGERVEVYSAYRGEWVHGFVVAGHVEREGYRLQRLSDGAVLPAPMSDRDVRPDNRPDFTRSDFPL